MERSSSATEPDEADTSVPVRSQDPEEGGSNGDKLLLKDGLRPSSAATPLAETPLADTFQPFPREHPDTVDNEMLEKAYTPKETPGASTAASDSPKMQLSNARHNLIKQEMDSMLNQVQGLEERISNTCNALRNQEQELNIRESKIAQREAWLRNRENSVLRRERKAQRRESELLDLETASLGAKSKGDAAFEIEARDQIPSFSLGSGPALLRSLTGKKKAMPICDESVDNEFSVVAPEKPCLRIRPSLRERYHKQYDKKNGEVSSENDATCASEQAEEFSDQAHKSVSPLLFRSASLDYSQLPSLAAGSAVSHHVEAHSSSHDPQTPTTPEAPVRQTTRSFKQRLSPFTPRTPPPSYRSPTAVQFLPTSTKNSTFWAKARVTGHRIFNFMSHPMDPNDNSGRRTERRINKLEQELKEADARLEKARSDERQKAVDRVRELQGF